MNYYLIDKTLQHVHQKEIFDAKKPYVAVLTSKQWELEKDKLGFANDLDNELDETLTTKANVNYESLSGTFSIPDRKNMDNDDFSFVNKLFSFSRFSNSFSNCSISSNLFL